MAIQQAEKLDGLRSEDEWLLILYDALRYDTFDHFMGETAVEKTVSPATGTHAWMERVWPDKYDVCYVTGSPLVGDHNASTYNGGEHFGSMVEVWKDNWDSELRTVRPEAVTAAAIDALAGHKRVMVHYVQPHAPYIGEPRIIGGNSGSDDTYPHPANDQEDAGVLVPIRNQLDTGDLTLETLRRAYYDNLVQVVEGSNGLIEAADRRTVITSDHGECLGEHTIGHNYNCSHVRTVPWYEPK